MTTIGTVVLWSASRSASGLAMAADRSAIVDALDVEEMKGLPADVRARWVDALPTSRKPTGAFTRAVERMHAREDGAEKRKRAATMWRMLGLDGAGDTISAGFIGEQTDGETLAYDAAPRFLVSFHVPTGEWTTTAKLANEFTLVEKLKANFHEERGLVTSERLGRWIGERLTEDVRDNAHPEGTGIAGTRVKQGSAVFLAPPGREVLIPHLDEAIRYATAGRIRLLQFPCNDAGAVADDVKESLLAEIAEFVDEAKMLKERGNAREETFSARASAAADMINRARLFRAVLGDMLGEVERAAKVAHDEIETIAGVGRPLTGIVSAGDGAAREAA